MLAFYDNVSAWALIIAAFLAVVAGVISRPPAKSTLPAYAPMLGYFALALVAIALLFAFEP